MMLFIVAQEETATGMWEMPMYTKTTNASNVKQWNKKRLFTKKMETIFGPLPRKYYSIEN